MSMTEKSAVVIGGGYGGLSAAYELTERGWSVTVLEAEEYLGGLAGTFELETGYRVERFYHHWFTSDTALVDLVSELGLSSQLVQAPSNTGLYYANSIFRLASPFDLLRFHPISLPSRIRTGVMALAARRINNWRTLESVSAADWITSWAGAESYRVIWEPLLRGKFGEEAENISAVWFWNKLKLRGSSRGKGGREELLYYRGGFGALCDAVAAKLKERGVVIRSSEPVQEVIIENGRAAGVKTDRSLYSAPVVLATVPLPTFFEIAPELPRDFREKHEQIRFLGNTCLVLRLSRSLSSTYWLNVADPEFPFVGVIEHTNFDPPENYAGDHIAYISKYLSTEDSLFQYSADELVQYCIPYLQRLFPEFSPDWIKGYHLWKARYSQPIITKRYSEIIPPHETPVEGLWLSTMAQIYPQDRGTNYAVEYGRRTAALIDDREGDS